MTNYSMINHTYRYYDGDPRFPFGYGLSYSIYNYHDFVLNPTRVKAGNNVTATFAITNQGPYGGREVKYYMSGVMRKLAFCICGNKDADKLRGHREADQRLCFPYIYSTIPLLSKSEIPSSSHLLWLYSPVCVRPGRNPQRLFFFTTRLISYMYFNEVAL